MKLLFALLVLAMTLSLFCRPVLAASHNAYGSLALETPVGATPDRPQDNSPTVLGELHLTHLLGPVGAFASGQLQTRKGLPFESENRYKVGLEAPVGGGLSVYTYFERRFDDPVASRYMLGAKWGFNVPF